MASRERQPPEEATAALVLEQTPAWLADYNAVAPHSALGYQSPQQYRRAMLAAGLRKLLRGAPTAPDTITPNLEGGAIRSIEILNYCRSATRRELPI